MLNTFVLLLREITNTYFTTHCWQGLCGKSNSIHLHGTNHEKTPLHRCSGVLHIQSKADLRQR
jgi:hypothetical protein